ncbi:MAG: efflux RND transporter periplasmic adaptor subunit [Bryobacteraceae bacterium]|nr:efflux RND transporter periplasmic adaptor subunit [Bryobacteraceae bacterium]
MNLSSNSARLLLLPAFALLFDTSCTKVKPVQAKQDNAPVQVKASPVRTRNVRRSVQSVGTMFPYDETVVSAEIEGRVLEVNADLGDIVGKGALLVKVSDEEQKYLLAQNEASLRMSMERVGLKNENDRIKDIKESSEVRRAQADLLDSEQRYKRTKSLVDQGIGSQSDFDQAQARYSSSRATYDQAINMVGNLLQDIERQKAAVELQRKKLRDATVYAPFAGSVKERQVTQGQYVRPNTPLFTLVKTDPIRLRLEVPERFAPWIKVGQTMQVQVEAFEDRKFLGKVWRISPTVEQSKRTFVVEALVDNPKNELKPGSYARVVLPTEKNEHILLVPVRAVTYLFGANKTFVVRNGNTIEAREVKVGDRFDGDVEILEGLQEGDIVATSQLNRLDTGTKVATVDDAPVKADKRSD